MHSLSQRIRKYLRFGRYAVGIPPPPSPPSGCSEPLEGTGLELPARASSRELPAAEPFQQHTTQRGANYLSTAIGLITTPACSPPARPRRGGTGPETGLDRSGANSTTTNPLDVITTPTAPARVANLTTECYFGIGSWKGSVVLARAAFESVCALIVSVRHASPRSLLAHHCMALLSGRTQCGKRPAVRTPCHSNHYRHYEKCTYCIVAMIDTSMRSTNCPACHSRQRPTEFRFRPGGNGKYKMADTQRLAAQTV